MNENEKLNVEQMDHDAGMEIEVDVVELCLRLAEMWQVRWWVR